MTDKEYFKWQSKHIKEECGEKVSAEEVKAY